MEAKMDPNDTEPIETATPAGVTFSRLVTSL